MKYLLLVQVLLVLYISSFASARLVWAVTQTQAPNAPQQLIQFDHLAPNTILSSVTLTPPAGEIILSIDVRPSNALLYALTSSGKIYTVNFDGTLVNRFSLPANCPLGEVTSTTTTRWSIDFNPVADAIRIISSTGTNFRVATLDTTPVCFVDGSVVSSNATTVRVYAIAYDNSRVGAASTTLYALTSVDGGPLGDPLSVGHIDPPNNGTFNYDGDLSPRIEPGVAAFDSYTVPSPQGITNTFIAALRIGSTTKLYTVAVSSGALTELGTVGDGSTVVYSIAAVQPVPFFFNAAVLVGNNIINFNVATPSTVSSTAITGALPNENFIGLTLRPATYNLYGITATGNIYILYPFSATNTTAFYMATLDCSITPSASNIYSFDFNPSADRLRIVSSTGENYRVNVETGQCIVDGRLFNTNDDSTPVASGVAYTNGFRSANPVALGTREFIINTQNSVLAQVVAPNAGNTTTVGPLPGITATGSTPIDILTVDNIQFAYFVVGRNLYQTNLATGFVTFIATFTASGTESATGLVVFPRDYARPNDVPVPRFPPTPGVPTAFKVGVLVNPTRMKFFNVDTAQNSQDLPIVGVTTSTLLGVTLRPSNYQLYAVAANSDLYILYPFATNVTAFFVAKLACLLTPTDSKIYSFDFNPVADRMRIVSSTGENYRVNVDNGGCIVDGNLFYVSDRSVPKAVGVSYTNGLRSPSTTGTAEYIIDANDNRFSRVIAPNDGNTTVIGSLGTTIVTQPSPLDIFTFAGQQFGYTVSNTQLWFINITTGALTTVATFTNTVSTAPIGLVVFPNDYVTPAVPVIVITTTGTTSASTGTTTAAGTTGITAAGTTGITAAGTTGTRTTAAGTTGITAAGTTTSRTTVAATTARTTGPVPTSGVTTSGASQVTLSVMLLAVSIFVALY